ncbi:hypothetical protein G9A89_003199 [Geosiphon pyriformis]|nr:hypothetical protein G9A89_003199 [Geosiphon pyriformis]
MSNIQIDFSKQATGVSFATAALTFYINGQNQFPKIDIEWKSELSSVENVELLVDNNIISGTSFVTRYLARLYPSLGLYGANALSATLIDHWVDFASDTLTSQDFKKLEAAFDELDYHLNLRSFFVGYRVSLADFIIWGALKNSPVFNRLLKTGKDVGTHLIRWYDHISSLDFTQKAIVWIRNQSEKIKTRSDQPNMNIGLIDAEQGKVVTRFPPEPSGYLHIGHAKAAMLNQYFARTYNGKLIVRFDDTNPAKEKREFEDSIREDLALLGIHADIVTYTSDHFDKLYEYALEIIKKGLAYVDDTDVATMRDQRMNGIASKSRDQSIEENIRRFKEMTDGTEFGLTCCLRAKIDMQNPNKALRDPVIYRCNILDHHRTGNKWKLYPTYDFACPIVDSIEGVTHALRTNEYRDRNAQYYWFLEALGLRKVHIWDFSRINFVYTLLSKRKLQWFVQQGLVSGWDDPRFPTVRGILRRGLTVEALKQYILTQGASQNDVMLEWDKLWALNKKIIDPVAPRHVSIATENVVKANIIGGPENPYVKDVNKHKKNPDLGTKQTSYFSQIFIEQEDAQTFEIDEEITLMDWGNAIIKSIDRSQQDHKVITSIALQLHLEGDFKKTKKKITWLADTLDICKVLLLDYDYLINKKKLEEGDEVENFVTKTSEFRNLAIADANVKQLRKGDIIQFERRGYYIVDVEVSIGHDIPSLIRIPDGKANTMASKAEEENTGKSTASKSVKKKGKKKETNEPSDTLPEGESDNKTTTVPTSTVSVDSIATQIKMYHVPTIYGDEQIPKPEEVTKIMAFGRPPNITTFTTTPPERGSFPLDHQGECKELVKSYLDCLKQNKSNNGVCRNLSKAYLRCRMERGLMVKDEFTNLGFQEEDKIDKKQSIKEEKK